jgi:hypothetical protein
MNIEQFIKSPQRKFAVITKPSWEVDEVAQSLAPRPVTFVYEDVEMALLSIAQRDCQKLHDYVQGNVEFGGITIGSGKVTLLLRGELDAVLPIIEES